MLQAVVFLVISYTQASIVSSYLFNNLRWQRDVWQETCTVTEQSTCVGNFACMDVQPPLNFSEKIGGGECSQVVYPYTTQKYIDHENKIAMQYSQFCVNEFLLWVLVLIFLALEIIAFNFSFPGKKQLNLLANERPS